jgi:hypothetical protein
VRIVVLAGSERVGHCEACECPVDPYGTMPLGSSSASAGPASRCAEGADCRRSARCLLRGA